jgi:hypothetical protein
MVLKCSAGTLLAPGSESSVLLVALTGSGSGKIGRKMRGDFRRGLRGKVNSRVKVGFRFRFVKVFRGGLHILEVCVLITVTHDNSLIPFTLALLEQSRG